MTRRQAEPQRSRFTLLYVVLGYVLFFACPVAVYVLIGRTVPGALRVIHYTVATAYLLTSVMILREARAAWRRRRAPVSHETTRGRLPLVTAIISAYLPNEQEIIAETVLQLSTQMSLDTHRLQIILAYNSPEGVPVEAELRRLAQLNSSFMALPVPHSRSKAENIMAALVHAKGEMTVILDADHHPLPDAFERAYRWLERGYDVVQGRCVVRKQRQSWLSRYLAVEFEQIYAVSHAGRSISYDVAIFGGSNGYWRTSVLRRIGMDSRMLTEDIDATVRSVLAGYRVIHDRSIVASELAPPNARAWWHQRLRWAHGWLQVTIKHQSALWRAPVLTLRQKAYWTYLLAWREFYAPLSLQVFALLTAAVLLGFQIDWLSDLYLLFTAVVTLASGPIAASVTYRVALWRTQERLRWWFVIYSITALPYTTLKNAVALVAIVRQLVNREMAWVVTPRSRAAETMVVVDGAPVEERRLPLGAGGKHLSSAELEFGGARAQRLLLLPSARKAAGASARMVPDLALRGLWASRHQREGAALDGEDLLGFRCGDTQAVRQPTTFDLEVLTWVLGQWSAERRVIEFSLRHAARDFGAAWSGAWSRSLTTSLETLASLRYHGDWLIGVTKSEGRFLVRLSPALTAEVEHNAFAVDWHVLRDRLHAPLERRLYLLLVADLQRRGTTAAQLSIDARLLASLGVADRGNVRRVRAAIAAAARAIQEADPQFDTIAVEKGATATWLRWNTLPPAEEVPLVSLGLEPLAAY